MGGPKRGPKHADVIYECSLNEKLTKDKNKSHYVFQDLSLSNFSIAISTFPNDQELNSIFLKQFIGCFGAVKCKWKCCSDTICQWNIPKSSKNITSSKKEVGGVRKRTVFADIQYYYADINGWIDG